MRLKRLDIATCDAMGRPVYLPDNGTEHVFVRFKGPVPRRFAEDHDLEVTWCSHDDMDGALTTEAVVSGPAHVVHATLADLTHIDERRSLKSPQWVRDSIRVASGREHTPGMLAIGALKADEDDLHLVSHPKAPSATCVLAQLSTLFDIWVQL